MPEKNEKKPLDRFYDHINDLNNGNYPENKYLTHEKVIEWQNVMINYSYSTD